MSEPSPTCPWCGKPFTPRRGGGSRQTFCGADCRHRFHAGARQWAEGAIAAGLLTIDDLKNGPGTACTLVGGAEQPSPLADMGRADAVRPDGSTMRFIIEIPRSVIDALIFLHRYLRFDQRDDFRAILAALDRLGRGPTITPLGDPAPDQPRQTRPDYR
jgi:hypothetical protein